MSQSSLPPDYLRSANPKDSLPWPAVNFSLWAREIKTLPSALGYSGLVYPGFFPLPLPLSRYIFYFLPFFGLSPAFRLFSRSGSLPSLRLLNGCRSHVLSMKHDPPWSLMFFFLRSVGMNSSLMGADLPYSLRAFPSSAAPYNRKASDVS